MAKRITSQKKKLEKTVLSASKKFSRESFSFCREVFLFAVRLILAVVGHCTKVRKTTSNWIVRILNKVGLQ